ncbi:MAG: hypothetical protein K6U80_13230 [Firmicutes bacterium]|nr:hypothetical protein [Bacillota bacterium]
MSTFKLTVEELWWKEELQIVLELERIIWRLNGLAPSLSSERRSLLVMLSGLKTFLERHERQLALSKNVMEKPAVNLAVEPAPSGDRAENPSMNQAELNVIENQPPPMKESLSSKSLEEIIALRDYVFAAREQGVEAEAQLAGAVFDWLGTILESMGVETILETGVFQPGGQKVAGKAPTNERDQDHMIKSTIRPGYRFKNRLIRAQEVIIYGYEE